MNKKNKIIKPLVKIISVIILSLSNIIYQKWTCVSAVSCYQSALGGRTVLPYDNENGYYINNLVKVYKV